jgi:hypothetical protein
MAIWKHPAFLRTVLLADAVTCIASGLLMTLGAGIVASQTALPVVLLISAGLSLFPIAAFIAVVATRPSSWPVGVWVVIFGNIGWIAGSVLLLFSGLVAPNGLGHAFVLGQALAVAILVQLEIIGVRPIAASA